MGDSVVSGKPEPIVQIKLEFGSVNFCRGRKTEPEKNPRSGADRKTRTGIELGSQR